MNKRDVVIVDGVRTAFGKLGGSLKEFTAEQLGGIGLKGLIDKTKICERDRVDNVYMGMAYHPAQAINLARWAMLYAGIPFSTSASTVELQCGSSIDCINHGAWKILANQADIVIAGGTESFSQLSRNYATSVEPYRLNSVKLLEVELQPPKMEGRKYVPLTEMGLTAENLAELYKISREEQDQFAFRSRRWAKRLLKQVILPRKLFLFPFFRAKTNRRSNLRWMNSPGYPPLKPWLLFHPLLKRGERLLRGIRRASTTAVPLF